MSNAAAVVAGAQRVRAEVPDPVHLDAGAQSARLDAAGRVSVPGVPGAVRRLHHLSRGFAAAVPGHGVTLVKVW